MASSTCDRGADFYVEMRALGYAEGRNIEYDCILIVDRIPELPKLAAEIAARKPALIMANASPAIHAAQRATSTIPIVMNGSADAVREGFVKSLARPGGNTTGVTASSFDLLAKRLQLGQELVPTARRIAVLHRQGASREPFMTAFVSDMETLAPRMNVDVKYYPVANVGEAVQAIQRLRNDRIDMIYLVETPILLGPHVTELARAVAASRIPTIGGNNLYCLHGAAIACVGSSPGEVAQQAARYVDRILKGAKPGDLAVEQPTRLRLLVNTATAKMLGVPVPSSLLQRADQVIE